MKKLMLLLMTIGLFATAEATKLYSVNTVNVLDDKNKACIEACNTCIASCKKVETMCSNEKNTKMAQCEKLCKQCIASCKACVKAMNSNDHKSKEKALKCAKICENCATECDKFDGAEFKQCAIDCRNAAKHLMEM